VSFRKVSCFDVVVRLKPCHQFRLIFQ
jgi:hypothetical protein